MLDLTPFLETFNLLENGICDKYTLKIGQEKYYFKKNYLTKEDIEIPAHIVEVLCSRILEQVGCSNFVKYDIAGYRKTIGCICKSYRKVDDEKEIDLLEILVKNKYEKEKEQLGLGRYNRQSYEIVYEKLLNELKNREHLYFFSIDNIIEQIKTYCENDGLHFDKEKTILELQEMAISDYFFYNDDRNCKNIAFLINRNNEMRLVPIFDNGMSFGFETYPHKPKQFLQLGISNIGTHQNFDNHAILKNNGLIVADIMQIYQNDERIKKYVDNFLALDIDQIISDFEVQENIAVDENFAKRIADLFKEKQSHFNAVRGKIEKRVNKSIDKCQNQNIEK